MLQVVRPQDDQIKSRIYTSFSVSSLPKLVLILLKHCEVVHVAASLELGDRCLRDASRNPRAIVINSERKEVASYRPLTRLDDAEAVFHVVSSLVAQGILA